MLDVDFFKKYNDYYGHPAGDAVLRMMGEVLRQVSGEERLFAARVGGEEFLVIWTENRVSEAERVALKLRERIHERAIPHAASQAAPIVTASMGLYILRGGTESTAKELYERVDSALYAAKKAGRDCIVMLDSDTMETRLVSLRSSDKAGQRPPFPPKEEA